jgi:hypothetical protein
MSCRFRALVVALFVQALALLAPLAEAQLQDPSVEYFTDSMMMLGHLPEKSGRVVYSTSPTRSLDSRRR